MENNQFENKEKLTADKIGSLTKQLEKNWQIIAKANNTWDFRSLEKARSAYAGAVEELAALWPVCLDKLNADAAAETAYISEDAYRIDLEQALQAVGIPLQGAFPTYEFPPFKLSIDIQSLEAKLKVGRKTEKTTAMNPTALAAWVEKLYQSLVSKKFDTAGFLKELLAAYKFANKIAFRDDEVQWGRAVHLDTLYELLTLKRSDRDSSAARAFFGLIVAR